MSVNRAIILGNVGKDPDIRKSQDGKQIASFSLATSESWKDKSGEKKENTTWHNVVVFGGAAGFIADYVKKGSKLYVEGSINNRSYEKDGVTKYITEIVVSGFNSKVELLDKPAGKSEASQVNEADSMESDSVPF